MTANAFILTVVWLGLAAHLLVALLVARQLTTVPLVPGLNLLVSVLILIYWAQRWFGYLFHGIKWYATDQLIPAYAIVILVVASAALWGRHPNVALHWAILALNGLVLLGACLLFAFLRFDRLI